MMTERQIELLQALSNLGGYLAVSLTDAVDPDIQVLVERNCIKRYSVSGGWNWQLLAVGRDTLARTVSLSSQERTEPV